MCGLATHIHSPIWSPLIQYVLRFDRFCHSRSISTGFARLSLFIFCLLSFYTFDEYDEQSSFMGIVGLCLLDSPLSSAFFVCIFWVPLSCFDLTASLHLCRCLPSSLLHTRSHTTCERWSRIWHLYVRMNHIQKVCSSIVSHHWSDHQFVNWLVTVNNTTDKKS